MTTKLIVVLISLSSVAKAGVEDFNSLIEQSLADQKKVSQDLQKQLHTKDLGKAHRPNFKEVGEDVLRQTKTETVFVESSIDSKGLDSQDQLDLDRKNLSRVSEEINDLK